MWKLSGKEISADIVKLNQCPNCGCGIDAASSLCEFCGAVIEGDSELPADLQVLSVVCSRCGNQNESGQGRCKECNKNLLHTCPRCSEETLHPTAKQCPRCALPRGEFFLECVRLKGGGDKTHLVVTKSHPRANRVFLGFAFLFLILAWYNHSTGHFPERNAVLFASAIYVLIFLILQLLWGRKT